MAMIELTEWGGVAANLKWPAVVALASQLLYFVLLGSLAKARYKHRIFPPATSGHPDFDRLFRVQMNFVEQYPLFALSLVLCSLSVSGPVAAVLGAVWVVFRALYSYRYAARKMAKDIFLYTVPQYLAVLLMFVLPVIRSFFWAV